MSAAEVQVLDGKTTTPDRMWHLLRGYDEKGAVAFCGTRLEHGDDPQPDLVEADCVVCEALWAAR